VLSRHDLGRICDVCGPPKGKSRKKRGCPQFRESLFQITPRSPMPSRPIPPDPQKPPEGLETQVPRSHTPDPSTSKRAEQRMRRSGRMSAQCFDVFRIVAEFPMNGAKALADLTVEGCAEGRWPSLCADDETFRKVQISRRLSDLKLRGLLIAHDHDPELDECPHEIADWDQLPDIEADRVDEARENWKALCHEGD
jgi:hypothetical protein